MIITKTFFETPKRRRYTWKAPGDIYRFQIDFILVKKIYRNQIKSTHSYPGFDIDSDHNLVLAKCNIKFKRRVKVLEKKWAADKLKSESTLKSFQEVMEITDHNSWEELKSTITQNADKILGKHILEPKKPWMTAEILELIKERNIWRNKDYDKYKRIKNTVTAECRKAKEKWMDENSAEIECMMNNNNNKVYAKVKRLQYEPRTRSNIVKDKEGRIVFDNEKVANRWKEYMEELYVGPEITFEDQYIENEEEVDNNMKRPPIDDNEFHKALKELSDKKSNWC